MNNNKWPRHLYALDVSRGIAALSVVLWHWQHFAFNGNQLSHDFQRENQPLYDMLRLFYEKGGWGVHYFFTLSGFIFFWLYSESINKKIVKAWSFGVQRFSRLYPLHIMTLLIVAFLQLLYVSRENESFVYPFNDTYHFLLNLLFVSNWGFEGGDSFNGPVWSVSVEIFLYIIFFFSVLFIEVKELLCLFISVVAFGLYCSLHNPIFLGVALFFLGGAVFHLTFLISIKWQALKPIVYSIAIISWICVISNCYIFTFSGVFEQFGFLGKITLLGFSHYIIFPFTICSLALVEIDKGPFLKSFSWVGNITYSSYLLHFPLQLLFALFVSYGILSDNFYMDPLYLAAFFILLIPLSHVVFEKFEKPMQNLIRAKLR